MAGWTQGWRARIAHAFIIAIFLAASTATVQAAKFGVPDVTGDPAGYFILTGPDTPLQIDNLSFGDNRNALDLYIEVTGATLEVYIYDPGLVSQGALDAAFDVTITGQTTYTVYDPGGTPIATQSFGADIDSGPTQTDQVLVNIYNGVAIPGLYRLSVVMDDTPADDDDLNTFGVSVPGYDMYSYYFTGGELNLAGATITEPMVIYPWIPRSSPPPPPPTPPPHVTGVDVKLLDFDAAVADPAFPPDIRFETPTGRGANLSPSLDNQLFTTQLGGLNVNDLDCSDYGTFNMQITLLDQVMEGTNDLNIVTTQIVTYLSVIDPADFPLAGTDPRGVFRIYYPKDDLSAPTKESLVHTAQIVSGADPAEVGNDSVMEVTLTIDNPTVVELTGVSIVTSLHPNTDIGDPVVISTTGGLAAVAIGKDITITGDVLPATTATVVYQTTIRATSPNASQYLTGDGLDLQGGALPTVGGYQTPFVSPGGPDQFGPICMLLYESVQGTCQATADLTGELSICPGETTNLDASASVVSNCALVEFRWLKDGLEIVPWGPTDMISEMPGVDTDYTVEVRCGLQPTCTDTVTITVAVGGGPTPPGVGNSLRAVKQPTDNIQFSWTPNGQPNYNVRQTADKTATWPGSNLLTTVAVGDWLTTTPQNPTPLFLYNVRSLSDCNVESDDFAEPEMMLGPQGVDVYVKQMIE